MDNNMVPFIGFMEYEMWYIKPYIYVWCAMWTLVARNLLNMQNKRVQYTDVFVFSFLFGKAVGS